ncbi:hypothetical protein DFQ28_000245, partial [Apophysomyces sp. BC1034]
MTPLHSDGSEVSAQKLMSDPLGNLSYAASFNQPYALFRGQPNALINGQSYEQLYAHYYEQLYAYYYKQLYAHYYKQLYAHYYKQLYAHYYEQICDQHSVRLFPENPSQDQFHTTLSGYSPLAPDQNFSTHLSYAQNCFTTPSNTGKQDAECLNGNPPTGAGIPSDPAQRSDLPSPKAPTSTQPTENSFVECENRSTTSGSCGIDSCDNDTVSNSTTVDTHQRKVD